MAKAIMIQGTMSNAGKSILCTALCRIFKQDGYKVAPFKSQNMALNSYITKEGLEMGRAQVVQAQAAGIEPSVLMNPILLKPTTDIGSQVIINGEVYQNMNAIEYFKLKKELVPIIQQAYDTLDKVYDIIVIEGAGSPAEINLKQQDIVNMGMAKLAKAPVLLVGDIDRGGVFAQLYGTMALLEEEERNIVKGFIINKFRGDANILEPGIEMLHDKMKEFTTVKVLGVVPYAEVDIEDEDSLSERLNTMQERKLIDIVVIKLPKISNFTDMNVFERYENISLRYVEKVSDFHYPDMIILPGTKSTIADLQWLRQSGLEAEILKAENKGSVIFGICGGYQMLGEKLEDPHNIEGGGVIKGLSLLPMTTTFGKEKTRKQISGNLQGIQGVLSTMNGLTYKGYEIHMGQSNFSEKHKHEESIILNHNHSYGTYIHGIFDEGDISNAIISGLCDKKGITLEKVQSVDSQEYKEIQFNKLADIVRKTLDMQEIYRIIEEGL